jgi:predicted transcriptional regulator of viral defense system
MRSLGTPYYIGLQSAAALYGAAHQQVQQLQIVTPRQERHIDRPGLSIRFFRKQNFDATPLRSHKGHSGMLPVSTPEATAIDLVRYLP